LNLGTEDDEKQEQALTVSELGGRGPKENSSRDREEGEREEVEEEAEETGRKEV
jgi:hypothetical protein